MAVLLVATVAVIAVRASGRTGGALPGPTAAATPSPSGTMIVPTHTRWPIQHVVILIKENRTFDHMFGRFPGANGVTTGSDHGVSIPLIPPPQTLPEDLPHDWADSFADDDSGKMDGFGRDDPLITKYAYSQMRPDQIPNYWRWAGDFLLSDNFFASHHGPSLPNHLFLIAAQSGNVIRGPGGTPTKPSKQLAKTWGCDAPPEERVVALDPEGTEVKVVPCFEFQTEADLLMKAGIDPHKRPRPDERIQRVVIHADISIQGVRPVDELQHRRNFVPGFDHLRHEIGSFHPQFLSQFRRRLHC